VFALSIASSVGGFFVCLFTRSAADANRGGAVGTVVALGFMFATRDYGMKLYNMLTRDVPEFKEHIAHLKGLPATASSADIAPKIVALGEQLDALVAALEIDGSARKTENKYLAFATGVGTLMTAFGDVIARHFFHLQ